ncbi:MAG: hypothetical protein WC480_01365 [Patescibacteria group bacterium]
MKVFSNKILIIIVTWFLIIFAVPAVATEVPPTLLNAPEQAGGLAVKAGYPEKPRAPEEVVGRLISYAMGALGVVFFVLMVYGGWLWLTASGNEEQITKAKKLIIEAVIGLAIIFAAYAITYFVVSKALSSITPETE